MQAHYSHVPSFMALFLLPSSYQSIRPGHRHRSPSCNKANFYGEDLLAPRPTPKLEDHPLSGVRDCLFNIFADAHCFGGRSSIRNLKTRHAVTRGTDLSWLLIASHSEKTTNWICSLSRVEGWGSQLLSYGLQTEFFVMRWTARKLFPF